MFPPSREGSCFSQWPYGRFLRHSRASSCFCCLATVDMREIRWIVSLNYSYSNNPAASDSSSNKHSVQVFAVRWSINLLARTRITRHILPRDQDIFYDGFFLSKRESQFTRQGSHDFFLARQVFASVIFFLLPAVLTRSLAQTGSGGDREYRRGWLSPRERDQRKNYQGSKRGPGFGPVGDLPHVNKDRASVAWCCPA